MTLWLFLCGPESFGGEGASWSEKHEDLACDLLILITRLTQLGKMSSRKWHFKKPTSNLTASKEVGTAPS